MPSYGDIVPHLDYRGRYGNSKLYWKQLLLPCEFLYLPHHLALYKLFKFSYSLSSQVGICVHFVGVVCSCEKHGWCGSGCTSSIWWEAIVIHCKQGHARVYTVLIIPRSMEKWAYMAATTSPSTPSFISFILDVQSSILVVSNSLFTEATTVQN